MRLPKKNPATIYVFFFVAHSITIERTNYLYLHMNAYPLETDLRLLLKRMEISYYQAIKSNEPFSVIKKHYAELKQLKQQMAVQVVALHNPGVSSAS